MHQIKVKVSNSFWIRNFSVQSSKLLLQMTFLSKKIPWEWYPNFVGVIWKWLSNDLQIVREERQTDILLKQYFKLIWRSIFSLFRFSFYPPVCFFVFLVLHLTLYVLLYCKWYVVAFFFLWITHFVENHFVKHHKRR